MNLRVHLMLCAALLAGATRSEDLQSDTWAATDALGRSLPAGADVGAPRAGRTVGIFYFIWHDAWKNNGPFDVSQILAAHPDARKTPTSPPWGPLGHPHYWSEPLFGYYRNSDPWLLRKHAQMLANAGVDTLIFDATNAQMYPETSRHLLDAFAQARRDGVAAPQICYMVNTKAGATARAIYETIYKPGLHRELWFQWLGKPLLICDPKEADDELRAFFTLRRAHWPFEMVNTKEAWHWETAFPQPYGFADDPAKPEQVNVSVAQNLRARDGKVTNMSDGNARGRGFHAGQQDASSDAIDRGANFEEQWKRAFELSPPFVMVTGWNEWIAGRFGHAGALTFVDQFDREFSRDIEPMKGGHGDNYYYQLAAGIRRYKGARDPEPVKAAPIVIDGRMEDWQAVTPEFRDPRGDALVRDYPGIGKAGGYTNRTARNDIVAAKVSADAKSVFFHARTDAPLTTSNGTNWMLLFIDIDARADTGWLGYDLAVGRGGARDGTTSLEKNGGGHRWEKTTRIPCGVRDRDIEIAVPRSAFGEKLPAEIRFKWADNIQQTGDATDFTLNGDSAPDDRFSYRARF